MLPLSVKIKDISDDQVMPLKVKKLFDLLGSAILNFCQSAKI